MGSWRDADGGAITMTTKRRSETCRGTWYLQPGDYTVRYGTRREFTDPQCTQDKK